MPTTRKEIAKENLWDLSTLYPTRAQCQAELEVLQKAAKSGFEELVVFKDSFHNSPADFQAMLTTYFNYCRQIEKVYTYAHLNHDTDIADSENKGFFDQTINLYQQFSQASSWIEPAILNLEQQVLEGFFAAEELTTYKFFLQKLLDQKKHVLPGDQERLIALGMRLQRTPSSAFSALANVDLTFDDVEDSTGEKHKLTQGKYSVFIKSPDRKLREGSFRYIHKSFKGFNNTLTELIHGTVQSHYFTAQARQYPSCLEAALSPNNIPKEVYTNLIDVVRESLPIMHDYVAFRKKMLGLDEIHFYDLQVPLVEEANMKFTYDEACDVVVKAVAPLGKEYQEIVKKGMTEDRWVDVHETKGKRSGAYSSGCYDSVPYILLNYQGQLNDVLTLAHEAGHSMHSLFSNRTQDYHYADYPIFLAEIASTANEALTYEYLLENAKTKEERLFILNQEIDSIRGTFYRQVMFAEFELKIHEAVEKHIPLTPAFLNKTYHDLNRDYFGPDLVIDEELDFEWSRVPHFHYNFYVYQYASGIAAANQFVEQIKQEGTARYLEFLSSGGSKYPIDTLKHAGVDMTRKESLTALVDKFKKLVENFKKEIEENS